jgi:ribosome-binding protein aMBF1 (putative translation factor)
MPVRIVTLNEAGRRIGESHPRAKLSNETVDKIREYHEDLGWSYERIKRKMNIAYETIARICRYEMRAQTPTQWRREEV